MVPFLYNLTQLAREGSTTEKELLSWSKAECSSGRHCVEEKEGNGEERNIKRRSRNRREKDIEATSSWQLNVFLDTSPFGSAFPFTFLFLFCSLLISFLFFTFFIFSFVSLFN